MYLSAISGIFDMKRTIKGRVGSRKEDGGISSIFIRFYSSFSYETMVEPDSEVPTTSKQLRVKFSRPETEWQKKRYEPLL